MLMPSTPAACLPALLQHMSQVRCPILFVAGERDTLAPMDTIFAAFHMAQHG